jgi:hypothetical protein
VETGRKSHTEARFSVAKRGEDIVCVTAIRGHRCSTEKGHREAPGASYEPFMLLGCCTQDDDVYVCGGLFDRRACELVEFCGHIAV